MEAPIATFDHELGCSPSAAHVSEAAILTWRYQRRMPANGFVEHSICGSRLASLEPTRVAVAATKLREQTTCNVVRIVRSHSLGCARNGENVTR